MLVFASIPDVYTSTPMEALYLEKGHAIQGGLASAINSNVAFWFLPALMLMFVIAKTLSGGAVDRQYAMVLKKVVGSVVLFLVGVWAIQSFDPGDPGMNAGPADAPVGSEASWVDMNGVSTDERFNDLRSPAPVMSSYAWVAGTIGAIEGLMTGVVKSVVPERASPAAQLKMLRRVGSMAMGDGDDLLVAAHDRLEKNCRNVNAVPSGTSMHLAELYDLDRVHTNATGVVAADCGELWNEFEQEVENMTMRVSDDVNDLALLRYGDPLLQWDRYAEVARQVFAGEAAPSEALERQVASMKMDLYLERRNSSLNAYDPGRNNEATMSNGFDQFMEYMQQGLIGAGLGIGTGTMDEWTRAAAANQLGVALDLIPHFRGMVHLGFAASFPLMAWLMCFGWYRPMMGWISGRMMLAMYAPMAQALYLIASMATDMGGALELQGLNDPLVTGGLSVFRMEVDQLQMAYMMAELATFLAFVIGSFGLYKGGLSFGGAAAGGIAGVAAGWLGGARQAARAGQTAVKTVAGGGGTASASGAAASTTTAAAGGAVAVPLAAAGAVASIGSAGVSAARQTAEARQVPAGLRGGG